MEFNPLAYVVALLAQMEQRALRAEAQRDQLAARVKELIKESKDGGD